MAFIDNILGRGKVVNMEFQRATVPGGTVVYQYVSLTVEQVRKIMQGADLIDVSMQGRILIHYESDDSTMIIVDNQKDFDMYKSKVEA